MHAKGLYIWSISAIMPTASKLGVRITLCIPGFERILLSQQGPFRHDHKLEKGLGTCSLHSHCKHCDVPTHLQCCGAVQDVRYIGFWFAALFGSRHAKSKKADGSYPESKSTTKSTRQGYNYALCTQSCHHILGAQILIAHLNFKRT